MKIIKIIVDKIPKYCADCKLLYWDENEEEYVCLPLKERWVENTRLPKCLLSTGEK